MTDAPGIALFCDLTPEELEQRIAGIRREVLPHSISKGRLADGRAWTFEVAMRDKLEHLVALERRCCGNGVTFALVETHGQLRLEVHGVDPDAAVFQALDDPLDGQGAGGTGRSSA